MEKYKRAAVIALLACLLYAGWRFAYTRMFLREAYAADGQTIDAEITVAGYPRESAYGYVVDGRMLGVSAAVYLDPPGDGGYDPAALKPGDVVTGGFRVKAGYIYGRHLTASQREPVAVTPVKSIPLQHRPLQWAEALRGRIDGLFSPRQAAFLRGLLTGDTSRFSEPLRDGLFRSGMSHVAAVSGLHISMLAGFLMLIVRRRGWAAAVCLPVIFLYAAAVGFPASAVRAALMYACFLLAPLLGRQYSAVRALLFAAAAILLVNPYAVQDAGFQLSFASVLGLTLFAGPLARFFMDAPVLRRLPEPAKRAAAPACAASLSALVFSAPVAAVTFDGVSLAGPLANILLLWIVNLIFLLAFGALALSLLWWPAAYIAAYPARWLLEAYLWAIDRIARVPFAALYTSNALLTAWLLFAYACLLTGFFRKTWKLPAAYAAVALLLTVGLTLWHETRFALTVTVLDVGQGQCVIVRSEGRTAVIDCGGNRQNPGRIAARHLQSLGETRIDYLLLTHAHQDHAGGVPDLLALMPVGQTLLPLTEEIAASPPPFDYTPVTEPQSFSLGAAQIGLITADWMPGANEQCMAVVVRYGDVSFVTTGDMDAASERWLLRAAEFPQHGVLLAGHHGSRTSGGEEWLEALRPQAVAVSAGRNPYGHPSPETLERFEAAGAEVYITRELGHITVRIPRQRG
ncbi:MAG: DNA internalization-related competence protein ComEC/Rec2 [Oscillospiraceae bacterium]|nr:DNA internalization-related competence protein ComEC/Rec2 [Oscillospiraceae bacterium]